MRPLRYIKVFIPPGPVLSLTLIGIMLLGTLLYYRAVRIQRFLEPSVAISEPRITFNRKVSNLLIAEFGSSDVQGLVFLGNQLLVHKTVLYKDASADGVSPGMRKLGRVFFAVLDDSALRPYIESIIISTRGQVSNDPETNRKTREFQHEEAYYILNALCLVEPGLDRKYPAYLESSVTLMDMRADEGDWVVFRIVQSDKPHFDMLQKLQKYAR